MTILTILNKDYSKIFSLKKVLVDCKPEVKKRERKIAVYHKRCTFKLSQDLFNKSILKICQFYTKKIELQ